MRVPEVRSSAGYEYGRGDHWSPAFRNRYFQFTVCCSFAGVGRATDGRPYGSGAFGEKQVAPEQPGRATDGRPYDRAFRGGNG